MSIRSLICIQCGEHSRHRGKCICGGGEGEGETALNIGSTVKARPMYLPLREDRRRLLKGVPPATVI